MEVRTSRFGTVNIADDRVITFQKGLLGFAECKRFCLLEPAEDACFFWLQSLEDPDLAFVVTDPMIFVPEYSGTKIMGSVTTKARSGSSSDWSQKKQASSAGSSRQKRLHSAKPSSPFWNVITRSSAMFTVPNLLVRTSIVALPRNRPAVSGSRPASLAGDVLSPECSRGRGGTGLSIQSVVPVFQPAFGLQPLRKSSRLVDCIRAVVCRLAVSWVCSRLNFDAALAKSTSSSSDRTFVSTVLRSSSTC